VRSKRNGLTIAGLMRKVGRQDGITLLELCIVMIILAILVSIVVPVLLASRKKADRVTAEYNLKIGGACMNRLYFKMVDQDNRPDSTDSYRDYDPPEAMRSSSEFQTQGYVSVGAEYMSSYESKIKWADLVVGGGSSEPVASLDISPALLAETAPYGFELLGVYAAGKQTAGGSEIIQDWSLLPGKICVVENRYFWEDGWHENENNFYVTLITLERSGLAHYLTMKQGSIADDGTFDWKNGQGTPGDNDDAPDSGTTPADSSPAPGGDTPGDVTPPGDTEPGDVTPPADDTTPTEPATEPTQPDEGTEQPPWSVVQEVRIEPEVINLKSNGDFSVFIEMEFKEGHSVNEIDGTSIKCMGAAALSCTVSADNKLVVKFDRRDLQGVVEGAAVVFTVTGRFKDGGPTFECYDTVCVI
jgi:Tfp pilus assembly protein PilE